MKPPNDGIQFLFHDKLYVSTVKVKKTKREKKDGQRNYKLKIQFLFRGKLIPATTRERGIKRKILGWRRRSVTC